MDEKIILALDKSEYEKADAVWLAVFNSNPQTIDELDRHLDAHVQALDANKDIVMDERYADWYIKLDERVSGDILLTNALVIENKEDFFTTNPSVHITINNAILWTSKFPVTNSNGDEVGEKVEMVLTGGIRDNRIIFDLGYYLDCPRSYVNNGTLEEEFIMRFEWRDEMPSVQGITIDRHEEQKEEVSEKTRQWEERWHKKSSLYKRARNFNTAEDYVDYLTGTYIPDLIEAGKEGTAGDFRDIIKLIRRGKDKLTHDDRLFIHYIETIIPDLKASGNEFTAEDYQEGIDWILEPNIEKIRQWEERWHKRSSLDKQAYTFSREEYYQDFPNGNRISKWLGYTADDRTHERTKLNFVEIRRGKKDGDSSDAKVLFRADTPAIKDMIDAAIVYMEACHEEELKESEKTYRWEERWHKRSELSKVGLNVGDRIPVNPGEYNTVVIANDGRILDYGRTYKIERPETGIIYDKLQVGGGAAPIAWAYIVKLYELYLMIDVESTPVSPETIRWEERWHKKSEHIPRFKENDMVFIKSGEYPIIEYPSGADLPKRTEQTANIDEVSKLGQVNDYAWAKHLDQFVYAVFVPVKGVIIEAKNEDLTLVYYQDKARQWEERWHKRSSLVKKALDYKEFEIERIPYGTDEDMFLVYNATKSGIGVQLTVELLDNDMQNTIQNYWAKVVYDWAGVENLPEYQEGLKVYQEKLQMLKRLPASDKARQWEERWHKRSSIKTAIEYPKGFHEMLNWIQHDEDYGYDVSRDIYEFQITSFALDWADQEVPCFAPYEHDVRENLIAWYRESILPTLGPRGEDIMSAVSEGWAYDGNIQVAEIFTIIESYAGIKIDYDEATNTYTCVDVDPSARTRKRKQFPPIQEKTREWEERWHKKSQQQYMPIGGTYWKATLHNEYFKYDNFYPKLALVSRATEWAMIIGENMRANRGGKAFIKGGFVTDRGDYKVVGIDGPDGVELGTVLVPENHLTADKENLQDDKTRQWEERWHKRSSMDKKAFFRVWNRNTESPINIPSQAITLEQFIEDVWRVLGPAGHETETPEGKYSLLYNDGYIIQNIPDTSRLEAPETEKTREWEIRWHKRSELVQV